jgi:DNA repair protein RadA/Sms
MANPAIIFVCSNCDAQYPKWQGRCSQCGAWGTLSEANSKSEKKSRLVAEKTVNLNQLPGSQTVRLKTNIEELDRVLGGGLVRGSLVLLGGDPGIGKSTLALQIAKNISGLLYISGEESAQQIKLRADRLEINLDNLQFLPQIDIESIAATISENLPVAVIIDSIQTMRFGDATGNLGTPGQIIACTTKLLELAKTTQVPIIIIGHVTKEGYVAGPKALEHLVDTVLYLENDNKNYYKILRTVKNRFGSTGEIGVFEMTGTGLIEINDPSQIFLDESAVKSVPGIVAAAVLEGQRPFIIEVQALVSRTAFGYPQRKATGFDINRLQMIIAVISKIAKLNLSNQDVYLNVAGGFKVKETSIDLAVAAAIISAFLDLPLDNKTLIIGEVGLSGEVRSVPQLELMASEGQKLKFDKIIIPNDKKFLANRLEIIKISDIKSLAAWLNKKT